MISIIVPVFNADIYLERAIESVNNQTYKNWELILIDDGSTDNSPLICDKAASSSSKITTLHIPNGGPSIARNAAFDIAKGDYIAFMDADDILPHFALQLLMDTILETKADIVCGKILNFHHVNKLPKNLVSDNHLLRKPALKTYSSQKALLNNMYQGTINSSVSAKLYSSKLWKGIRFRENTWYEDLDIFYQILCKIDKLVAIDSVVYLYRQHPKSFLHTFNNHRTDVLEVTQILTDYMLANNPALLKAAKSRQLSANFNMFGLISANKYIQNPHTLSIADQCWDKIKELRLETLCNPNVRLKNKTAIILSYLFGRKGIALLSRLTYKSNLDTL